jgi:spermidine/putrescine transport system substrate-binding protein
MAEVLKPPTGVYTRRYFLRIAAGSALAVAGSELLAACAASPSASSGGGSTPTPPGAATATAGVPTTVAATATPAAASATAAGGAVGGTFAMFTWNGYDGGSVKQVQDWLTTENITLDVKYISNENLITFFRSPGAEKWDASSVNQGDAEYTFAQKVSSEITVAEVPALATMLPFFRDGTFWKVRDGVYNSVPWTWGPIGINTRTDRVPATALKSYAELLDPKWKGRIGTFDDALNMISTACCATGNDPAVLTREQLNGPVKDWLVKLKPQLKVLSTSIGDQENLLFSGDVDIELVGLTWFVGDAKKKNVALDFRVPDEGAYGFVDALFIPPTAPHRANAVAWANMIMSPDTAAPLCNSVSQLSTVPDVNAKIDPAVRATYPDDLDKYTSTTLKWNKSWYDAGGQYATIDEWRKVWEDVKALA